jgi:dihydrofolate reductase
MRKLILDEWVTLDGYVADRNNQLDFFSKIAHGQRKYSDEAQLQFLDSVDTILFGRKTYELFADFWPTVTNDQEIIADKLNEMPKIVFSNTLKKAPWGKRGDITIIHGHAGNHIREMKSKQGKNMVIWGGISLVQSLMAENLINEYRFRLCPIILGGGRPLFKSPGDLMNLKLEEVSKYDKDIVFLRYGALWPPTFHGCPRTISCPLFCFSLPRNSSFVKLKYLCSQEKFI